MAINRRLAELDPSNADWQQDLATAHSRVGDVLIAQSQWTEGIKAYLESLSLSRRLAEQDRSNADWQHGFASACFRIGLIAVKANFKDIGLPLYEESLRIFTDLVQRAPGYVQWAQDKKFVEEELTALRAAIASSPDGTANGGQTP